MKDYDVEDTLPRRVAEALWDDPTWDYAYLDPVVRVRQENKAERFVAAVRLVIEEDRAERAEQEERA